jgi:hypothetical protein
METSGRERRHRYYTIASYRKLVAKENLDNSTAVHAEVDLSNVGGFSSVDPTLFYDNKMTLFKYQDMFKDKEKAKTGKGRKHPLKNPILPDGSVKQGRPRKYPVGEDPKSLRKANKRKREEAAAVAADGQEMDESQPTKKRRRVTTSDKAMQDDGAPAAEDDGLYFYTLTSFSANPNYSYSNSSARTPKPRSALNVGEGESGESTQETQSPSKGEAFG